MPAVVADDAAGPCGRAVAGSSRYDHVVWVWMENKDPAAISTTTAPFLTSIGAACATATDFVDHGLHPSLPNYIAATTGDPQGVRDDGPPSAHPLTADNIFRQVRATGRRAISYEESMSGTCALTATRRYAVKHNPAAYFVGGDDRAACNRDDVPFDQLATDLAADDLPAFAFVTPDICNDMHSCPVATGDRWLQQTITAIVNSTAYTQDRTIILITFDESEGAGTMPFVAIAPGIHPGTRATEQLDHDAVLAFTEDALAISTHLGHAADAADLAAALGLPSA
jgi:phospholipase C